MNYKLQLLFALVVVAGALVVCCLANDPPAGANPEPQVTVVQPAATVDQPGAVATTSAQKQPRENFKLPKLFDFDIYRKLFHKTYSSIIEEVVRRKYMLAKALRSAISAIKYKRSVSSSFLGINHLSDRSPRELDRLKNKELIKATLGSLNATRVTPSHTGVVAGENLISWGVPEVDPNQVESELHKLVGAKDSDNALNLTRNELGLGLLSRKKRETRKLRELPLDRLFNVGENVELNEATKRKLAKALPPSNNPDYVQPELTSMGLRQDLVEDLNWYFIDERSSGPLVAVESLVKQSLDMPSMAAMLESNGNNDDAEHTDDQLIIDHRKSNCFNLPRDQGDCGSCYAFAATALFEWLYCMKSGTLVAFSEQYMVDCGATVGNNGCDGGLMYATGKFVHNYGLELRVNYPYQAQVDQCPYHDNTDPKQMGYLRMDLTDAIIVPLKLFEEYLQVGPIMISVSSTSDFLEYAGGVHEGIGCNTEQGDHAMLLIGQGVQDGRDYWLIRNSHSVGWGEGGYYKLWKGSKCIVPDHGIMYGTSDGLNYPVDIKENQANDKSRVRQHYVRKLNEKIAE